MIINEENMTALRQVISGAFQQGLDEAMPRNIDFMTLMMPSTGESNLYPFMEDMGSWREWLGDRNWNNLRYGDFRLVNRDWEKSYRLPKKRIDDDQYATFPNLLKLAGAGWPHLKVSTRLDALLTNALCMDGKAIAANDHAFKAGSTIDNLTTDALSVSSFEAAFIAAAGWVFANGLSCGTRFTHLLIGEKLRGVAHGIVGTERLADNTTNPNYKRVETVILDEFSGTYDDYWMLIDASKPIKPVILQVRQEAEIVIDSLPEHVKRTGNLDVMADGRMAAAPTMPNLVYQGRL